MRLLVVAPGPPSAGGKGFQSRLHHQILELAKRHQIFLIAFADSPDAIEPGVRAACRDLRTVKLSRLRAAGASVANSSQLPLSVGLFLNRRMALTVRDTIETFKPDLVHVQLVRMAPYLRYAEQGPVILDLLDAAELNMRERARAMPLFARAPLLLEARRLGIFERHAARLADLSIFISERDRMYAGNKMRMRVNPNGVEIRDRAANRDRSTIVFSGTMSYFPNSDAATWFASTIFPLVRREIPDAVFRVVGRNPTREIRSAAATRGVEVTGVVPVMADALERATVSVCPMRYGSGLQTKILEAMAVSTPVVATSKAVEGIPATLIDYVTVADSAQDFAKAVISVLQEPGAARNRAIEAFAVIKAKFTWAKSVSDLEDLYREAIEINRAAHLE